MPTTSLFRTLLISGLLMGIISVVAGMTLTNTLPPVLQEYLASTNIDDMSDFQLLGQGILMLVALLSILILVPVSTIGLWNFKRWARTLYVVTTILVLPFYPAFGPIIQNGWQAMFYDSSLIISGILLAMMFVGPISAMFDPFQSNKSI